MKTSFLSGLGVALITPFTKGGEVDYLSLEKVINYCIGGGVDFLVALGTTAEVSTLSEKEKTDVSEAILKINAKRLPVVLGLGGNNTNYILDSLKDVNDEFAAILSVAPYYNKPTQKGLYAHYEAIAKQSSKPIIIYNIPGRSVVNIEPTILLDLAYNFKNIKGVKEASGNMKQISDIIRLKPDDFSVFSGDDALTFSLMCLGADGCISTSANILPKQLKQIIGHVGKGELEIARELHYRALDLMSLLFEQGNPSGIKAALACKKLCENYLRLPLLSVDQALYNRIFVEVGKI